MVRYMIKGMEGQILLAKYGIGFINMDGVKMELNSKKIDFSNKTELVKLLDKFHDSTCNFKVIDEKKLKITFYTIEGEIRYILINTFPTNRTI